MKRQVSAGSRIWKVIQNFLLAPIRKPKKLFAGFYYNKNWAINLTASQVLVHLIAKLYNE